MKIGDAVRAGTRGYWSRLSGILPFYLFGLSTAAVGQTVWLVGGAAAYLTLSAQGSIAPIREELEAIGPVQIDDPAAIEGSPDALADALAAAVTPELVAVVAVTALAAVVLTLAAGAVAAAGQVHAVYAALRGRDSIRAGVDGVARDAVTFVALLALQVVCLVGVAGLLLAGIAAGAAAGPATGLLALLLVPLLPLGLLAVRLAFLFARQAVVVDGVGTLSAVRRSVGYARSNPADAVVYLLLWIVALVAVAALSAALSVVSAPAVGSLVGLLVVTPVLAFVKTALYADHATGRLPRPAEAESGAVSRARTTFRDGIAALWRFVVGRPLLQAASATVFALGGVAGWRLAAGFDAYVEASIAARLGGWFPPAAFLNLAANNWQVGVTQAYSGFFAGVPTVASLLINGLYLGAAARIEVDPVRLATFVAPHGVLEIPAVIVAGALGLHLGGVGVRAATGRVGRADVAAAVERAFRILLGLLVVFLVAAAIEAFVSPYYAGLLGI